MGTLNGGTIISFTPTPSFHAVNSRMPSTGCANFTFQIPSIVNAARKNNNFNSAERRAKHNAIERARRECLNTKFQELAHALPTLAQVRRPSKSIIVQKSLDFVRMTRQKEALREKEMRTIRTENESLREELNKLREQLGLEPLPKREEPKPTPPQHADAAKEDANISNDVNNLESTSEADNNPATPPTALESPSSDDVHIKSEGSHSDDDYSNEIDDDDDYDFETSHLPSGSPGGLMYPNMLDPTTWSQHASFSSADFSFPMDVHMNHMVDANTLHLQFDEHEPLEATGDIEAYCDQYPLTQNFFPSPPYEAKLGHADQIAAFVASPETFT